MIRSEPNEGACGFAKQGSGVRGTAVRRGGFRDADNEVAMGDGPGASVALQRPRTAMARSAEPIGGDASFEERRAASERKLARLAMAPRAPPWTSSLANRQKKRPVPCRVMAGTGPEGYRYAAARRTGIPILRALSTRLFVMPEPGKARRPFGRKFSRTSLRRKGAALPSRSQLGLHTTW